MKPFPTSAACCFGILFISVSLKTTGSSEVVGSADPVVALAGDDVILPCSLKPRVSAEDMVVKWTGLFLETRNVHLYLDGRDSNEEQHPFYSGRTSMFHEELKNGNVSLKLTRVTLSDAGSYRCFIPTLKKETTVQLFVGAVSQPVISIDGTKGWGVVLKCESGGWYPEPEMEWLDSSGSILPPDGPPERHSDSEGLYTVRQHVTVDKTDTNRFTCRVQQLKINHKKGTEFHVPDEVFPKGFPKINIAFIGFGIACTSIPLWCILYDWCEKKQALKKQAPTIMQTAPTIMQTDQEIMLNAEFRREMAEFRREMDPFRKENDPFRKQSDELKDELNVVTRERDELKEQLRKAEVTIKTLSTSPGGQQKTQTPSQKGMEMKPLLGQKDDLDEMERGGRVTTEVDYRAAVGLL